MINKFVGREKDIDNICDLLVRNDFIAITGPAGIGKSRLAVATIEKYSLENKEISVLCVKSFGDYISAIEESIEDSKQYLLLIDDASNLKRFDEVIKRFEEANQMTLIESLYSLFLEKKWTVKEFTQETALTKDLFSKIKNKQRKSLEKKTLIQILIGLRLPKDQRDYLLEKNQTQLSKYDLEDVLYDFMLASGIGIDDADALLKELGKEGFIKK